MTLPSVIAVGNHAHDGEITDLQSVAQAWLSGHIPSLSEQDGYDATGKLDQATLLNAALAAASGPVWVPAGTYRLTSSVTIPTGKRLICAGPSVCVFNYSGASAAFIMDGCQGSALIGARVITSDGSAGVYGVWIKNTSAASQFNKVEDCIFIQNNATARTTGQYAIVIEDNATSTLAQFWHTIRDCRFFNWDQGIWLVQSGAGADGVNQSFFENCVEIACNGGMTVNPRTGDHVIVGMFGSHSSPSAFTDVVLTLGDSIPSNPNGGGVQAFGLVSDMGASGSAFKINNHSVKNILIANNESSGTDSNGSDSTNITIDNKGVSPTGRNVNTPSGFFSGANSFAATAQALTLQETNTRNVANTNVSPASTDRQVIYTSITAARTVTLPAPGAGNRIMIYDGSGSASGVNTISVTGNINGTAGATVVAINSGFGSSEWESTSSTWFLKAHNP